MAGKHGFGAEFHVHNGTALTKVAEVFTVKPPNPTVETIDMTSHDSAGGMREFIAGLIDPGEGSVTINLVPGSTNDALLASLVAARRTVQFKVVLPAATGKREYSGLCIPTGYEKSDVTIDDKMTAVFSFRVSGVITEAAVAP